MRLGRVWAAAHILSLSLWLVFSLVALGQSGTNSPVIRNYIIVIIVAGLLSGWRSAILFSGLCLLSVLLIYMAQVLWLWPPQIPRVRSANEGLIGLLISITLAGILVSLATHGMEQAFRRARRKSPSAEMQRSSCEGARKVFSKPNGLPTSALLNGISKPMNCRGPMRVIACWDLPLRK